MNTRTPWKFTVLRILPGGWEVIATVTDTSKARAMAEAEKYCSWVRERHSDTPPAIVNAYTFKRMVGDE